MLGVWGCDMGAACIGLLQRLPKQFVLDGPNSQENAVTISTHV